jgi:hypothetical protein
MIAAPPYSELNVDRCAHWGTVGNFRRVPFLRDLVFGCLDVAVKLRTTTLYPIGAWWDYERLVLQRVSLGQMSIHRSEFTVRTGKMCVQAAIVATLRCTKGSHLLHR